MSGDHKKSTSAVFWCSGAGSQQIDFVSNTGGAGKALRDFRRNPLVLKCPRRTSGNCGLVSVGARLKGYRCETVTNICFLGLGGKGPVWRYGWGQNVPNARVGELAPKVARQRLGLLISKLRIFFYKMYVERAQCQGPLKFKNFHLPPLKKNSEI